jgi:hypothetical protein
MCNCATKMDAALKAHNYMLCRNLLEGDKAAALVEITKIDRKKRTGSMSLVASYCPFCGKKYPKRKSWGVLKPPRASRENTHTVQRMRMEKSSEKVA